eukprot:CAMPEP_0172424870 /NCGR_PEP_ID=MMETSP1064-20121228/28611_1 /TAXON_ID=202472 /ORGANISM="Aulacoseira subarctica , Strain CCAP 1002/5" /LENGTH=77 /DNA_ID=CAMNT_0013167297 /DNA_START=126 /DNA_END=359 /DNA_ORIENTATION=-
MIHLALLVALCIFVRATTATQDISKSNNEKRPHLRSTVSDYNILKVTDEALASGVADTDESKWDDWDDWYVKEHGLY